jgi:hypothetical protein
MLMSSLFRQMSFLSWFSEFTGFSVVTLRGGDRSRMLAVMSVGLILTRFRLTVKKHHDKRARDLPKLKEGQSVFFEQKENENWKLGQIIDQCNVFRCSNNASN